MRRKQTAYGDAPLSIWFPTYAYSPSSRENGSPSVGTRTIHMATNTRISRIKCEFRLRAVVAMDSELTPGQLVVGLSGSPQVNRLPKRATNPRGLGITWYRDQARLTQHGSGANGFVVRANYPAWGSWYAHRVRELARIPFGRHRGRKPLRSRHRLGVSSARLRAVSSEWSCVRRGRPPLNVNIRVVPLLEN